MAFPGQDRVASEAFRAVYHHPAALEVRTNILTVTRFDIHPVLRVSNLNGKPAIVIFSRHAGMICVPIPYDKCAMGEFQPPPTDLDILGQQIANTLEELKPLFGREPPQVVLVLPWHSPESVSTDESNARLIHMAHKSLPHCPATMYFYRFEINYASKLEHQNALVLNGLHLSRPALPKVHFNSLQRTAAKVPALRLMVPRTPPVPCGAEQQKPGEFRVRGIEDHPPHLKLVNGKNPPGPLCQGIRTSLPKLDVQPLSHRQRGQLVQRTPGRQDGGDAMSPSERPLIRQPQHDQLSLRQDGRDNAIPTEGVLMSGAERDQHPPGKDGRGDVSPSDRFLIHGPGRGQPTTTAEEHLRNTNAGVVQDRERGQEVYVKPIQTSASRPNTSGGDFLPRRPLHLVTDTRAYRGAVEANHRRDRSASPSNRNPPVRRREDPSSFVRNGDEELGFARHPTKQAKPLTVSSQSPFRNRQGPSSTS